MDLQMPVMNGFEATAVIKQTQPDLPIIPHGRRYARNLSTSTRSGYV